MTKNGVTPVMHTCWRYALQILGVPPMTSTVSCFCAFIIKTFSADVSLYARGSWLVPYSTRIFQRMCEDKRLSFLCQQVSLEI